MIRLVLARFMVFVCAVFLSSLLHAGKTIFAFTPTTPTTIALPINGIVTVQYRVTNQTHLTRTLVMRPIQGVAQRTTTTGDCDTLFTLIPSQSCLLTLIVNGSEMAESIHGGPVVCKIKGPYDPTPDPFLCAEPVPADVLAITRGPIGQATLSVTPAALELTVNGKSETVTVTNTSPYYITATNVVALGVPASITSTSSHCEAVVPGAPCEITFTPGALNVSLSTMQIKGTTTTATPVTIQVGGVWLTVEPKVVNLDTASVNPSVAVTVRNHSNIYTANAVSALNVPATITQTVGAGCSSIPPLGTCTLVFTETGVVVAPAIYSISGTVLPWPQNVISTSITLGVDDIIISATPEQVTLLETGTAVTVTVTNHSGLLTAHDVTAVALPAGITQAPLAGCPTVLPVATCTLTYTPSSTATPVDPTLLTIKGSDTYPATINISAVPIPLGITGSPLNLQIGVPSGGAFTIQNLSDCSPPNTSCATAASIMPTLSDLPTNVTLGPNNCTSVSPQDTCTMTFYPPLLTPTSSARPVTLAGDNTSPIDGAISVSDGINSNLTVTPTSLSFYQGCRTPSTVTITNSSPTVQVIDLRVALNPAALAAGVTLTNHCPSFMDPDSTCTADVTVGNTVLSNGTLTVSASNTSHSIAPLNLQVLASTVSHYQVCDAYPSVANSVVYDVELCTNQAKIAWRVPGGTDYWSDLMTGVKGINQNSTVPPDACNGATDGACNTTQIISTFSSAPQDTAAYSCTFNGDYMPALNELETILTIVPACPQSYAQYLERSFWSSTQHSTDETQAYSVIAHAVAPQVVASTDSKWSQFYEMCVNTVTS